MFNLSNRLMVEKIEIQQYGESYYFGDHTVPKNWEQFVVRREPDNPPDPPIIWGEPQSPDDAQPGYGYIADDTAVEEETFFYHSDHLGSTSYITDQDGNITQYTAYLPYGELLVDEHSSSEDLPYKFNGKELDEETGLYYYGARYMQPAVSIWYGVDPLTEKYTSVSGYAYCLANPVNRIDYDGRDEIHVNQNGQVIKCIDNKSENITIVNANGERSYYADYQIAPVLFGFGNGDNRQIIANVTGYYARKLGIKATIGATYKSYGKATAFYDYENKGIWIPPGKDGTPTPLYTNKYNLMNALLHEYYHSLDDKRGLYNSHYVHASVVLRASSHWTFGKASQEYQNGQVGYFAQLIMNAYNQQNLIDKFNSMNKGGYRLELNHNGKRIDVYQGKKYHGSAIYKASSDKVNLK